MGGKLIFIVGEGGPPYGGDTFWRGGNGPRRTPWTLTLMGIYRDAHWYLENEAP